MSTATQEEIQAPAEHEQKFDIAKFVAERNERETAIRSGQKPPEPEAKQEAVKETDDKKPEAEESKAEKDEPKHVRSSGDRRLFRKLGAAEERNKLLEQRIAELERSFKKVEQEPPQSQGIRREDYATDLEYAEAKSAEAAEKAVARAFQSKEQEARQEVEVKQIAESFDKQIREARETYEDWDDLVKTSKAAKVDVYKEAPEIYMAFMASEYAGSILHEWLSDPATLNKLLDQYKDDPITALKAFHRFEGKISHQIETKTPSKKQAAKEVIEETKQKPKPTGAVRAPAGEAPEPEPAIGSAAWMAKRNSMRRERGW